MSTPRVLFYVQHLLGIGHLARASRVATALVADGFDVTVVTGGFPIRGFPDAALKHVMLPPVGSSEGFSGLVDSEGKPVDEAFKARRVSRLLETLEDVRPDIVVVEAFPFGRRQMRFELLPLIEAIAASRPKPRLVTSVRDILQERAKAGRDEETVTLLNAHFDLVMVHGDPAFAELADTFPLASAITTPIAYTGLVAAPATHTSAETFDVLVSAGGGAAGAGLVQASVDAARSLPASLRWCMITGPNLADDPFDISSRRAPANMEIFRFRADFTSLLRSARLSVSQAGYNTVCDILQAGCRSLLVPFSAGGETEQSVRAERLAGLGLVSVVAEDKLNGEILADAIATALSGPGLPVVRLDLGGAAGSAKILRSLLQS